MIRVCPNVVPPNLACLLPLMGVPGSCVGCVKAMHVAVARAFMGNAQPEEVHLHFRASFVLCGVVLQYTAAHVEVQCQWHDIPYVVDGPGYGQDGIAVARVQGLCGSVVAAALFLGCLPSNALMRVAQEIDGVKRVSPYCCWQHWTASPFCPLQASRTHQKLLDSVTWPGTGSTIMAWRFCCKGVVPNK